MAFTRSPLSRITVFLVILALPTAVFAGGFAKMTGGGSNIEWQISASGYSSVQLRVSKPDGQVETFEFKQGRTPALNLQDLGRMDGTYQWEMVLDANVPEGVRKQLDAARAANDVAAAAKIMKDAGLEGRIESGSFTVSNSMIVTPDRTEGKGREVAVNARPGQVETLDQVIPDDLIVQGSLCVGLDCVNNENFGFDTIRLKENNTRIHFDDTSTSAGFPANDWRLIANDSASGGSSKFSIEDSTSAKTPFTITAGAATNSIFADSTGRIGLRTSTPVLDLHINTSNTPAIRLEQNNSGGFTAQTWDIGANEANFFVRDVTGGSKLSLRIRPGAPTSSVDISADGDVGVGTGSPEAKLHVFGASNADTFIGVGNDPDGSAGTESALTFGYAGASFGRASAFLNVRPDTGAVAPNPSLRFLTGNNAAMIIDNQGFIGIGNMASGNPTNPIHYTNTGAGVTATLTTAGVWTDNSSRKAKEHIISLDAKTAFEALKELEPVTYNYKILPDDPKVGFIAEDVPDLVANPERNGLSALDIVAVVTRVVKEQQKTIEELNARIAQLEKEKQQ